MKTSEISIWTQVQCQIISNLSRNKMSEISLGTQILHQIQYQIISKTPKSYCQWYVSNPIPNDLILFQETNIRDLNMNSKMSNPIPNNLKLFQEEIVRDLNINSNTSSNPIPNNLKIQTFFLDTNFSKKQMSDININSNMSHQIQYQIISNFYE